MKLSYSGVEVSANDFKIGDNFTGGLVQSSTISNILIEINAYREINILLELTNVVYTSGLHGLPLKYNVQRGVY
jgi:hypothetical protein